MNTDQLISRLLSLITVYGFTTVLDGSTGYVYSKCRYCGGHNSNKPLQQNETDFRKVKHADGCKIASVLEPK